MAGSFLLLTTRSAIRPSILRFRKRARSNSIASGANCRSGEGPPHLNSRMAGLYHRRPGPALAHFRLIRLRGSPSCGTCADRAPGTQRAHLAIAVGDASGCPRQRARSVRTAAAAAGPRLAGPSCGPLRALPLRSTGFGRAAAMCLRLPTSDGSGDDNLGRSGTCRSHGA